MYDRKTWCTTVVIDGASFRFCQRLYSIEKSCPVVFHRKILTTSSAEDYISIGCIPPLRLKKYAARYVRVPMIIEMSLETHSGLSHRKLRWTVPRPWENTTNRSIKKKVRRWTTALKSETILGHW